MRVYRITKSQYQNDLSGFGAKFYGGRWNAVGLPVVYCADYPASAILESLTRASIAHFPPEMVIIEIDIADEFVAHAELSELLPEEWKEDRQVTVSIGSKWLRDGEQLCLFVPSALAPIHCNVLINPLAKGAAELKITHIYPLQLDQRLF